MRYIHLECLRSWVASACKIVSTESVAQIPSTETRCQLCGKLYKAIQEHKNKVYSILYDSSTIKPPYIQLNLLEKGSNQSKTSYIVSFNAKYIIQIGRGTNC